MAPPRAIGAADSPGPRPSARGVVPSSSACSDRVPLHGGFGSSLHAVGSEFGSQTNTLLDSVDLVEQLARHFSRPLTKEQMEAIMELATQGKEKEGIKKKGSKVTPLQAPIIEASEMR
ncbi:uncharacterized protein [Zea mays]|uniref:uncharacterized protein isoform X1 n=1 Tax=Zea mays TaxID=4577 RepID=UPI0004DEB9D6|nr:uncharacterized protein LOC103641942 isoform X1 [Zea mays]|eukprot:XP_008663462.1 uncharacterized protein LOC103641942 isoform X1 [Zea mays]